MHRLSTTVLIMLLAAVSAAAQEYTRSAYIEKYWRVAVEEMHKTGIPASITLAQACLESDNGNSFLAVKANNHFGIKCHNWTGKTVRMDDDRRNECFRKYDNPIDSYRDHSDFLVTRQRYAFLFDLERDDYEGWAYGLSRAGYATNPSYPQLLIRIIEDNGLARFDRIEGSESPSGKQTSGTSLLSVSEGDGHYVFNLTRVGMTGNGVKYVVAADGETVSSIAAKYGLSRRELLRYNDMFAQEDGPVAAGTVLYLSPKKARAARGTRTCTVGENETAWDISQRYAVRLRSLYRMNKIDNNTVLEPGTVLKLR